MGLLNSMKDQINKSGGSRKKIFFVKSDSKQRVRFLVDFEDGNEYTFHDSFEKGINALCQEELGKDCELCDVEGLRTRKLYCWPVWNYDAKEVQLFLFAANSFTPVPSLIGMYETYGTMIDRDFVISRQGKETNTSYSVVPMDKAKFRNKNAKVPTSKAILKILDEAFPLDEINNDEEAPKKKGKGKKAKEEHDDDDDDFDEDDLDKEDYEEMSIKELYNLCKQRGIKAKPKKKAQYYIDLLEEDDEEEYDEDDEDEGDDDEW